MGPSSGVLGMSQKQDSKTLFPDTFHDPLSHVRTLAKKALAAPADLTREQIQELGYALLLATRDDVAVKTSPERQQASEDP